MAICIDDWKHVQPEIIMVISSTEIPARKVNNDTAAYTKGLQE
jgi:hypothetical protein